MLSISSSNRLNTRFPMVDATILALLASVLWPQVALAQGLPVDTGSHIPVALWLIGAGILGLVLAYGILNNRKRTRADRQRTEQGARDLYKEEDLTEKRDRVRSGADL